MAAQTRNVAMRKLLGKERERKPEGSRRAMQGMETPGPVSVPPHPVEHPQRTGMDRQHRAVDGHGHPTVFDRRRVKAMSEGLCVGTDVGFGADRNGRRLVAGDKVAAAGITLGRRRLAAVRREVGAGIGARAARIGSDCRVNVRPTAAAVRRCVDHSRRVNGGDARSQGRDDGRGTVATTPGAGTAGTRGQEGSDDQGCSEGEPRPWARGQRPEGTPIQPGMKLAPASLRSTDRAQTHPEGEPQARIGSSRGHRNPPSPCRSPRVRKKDAAAIHFLSRVGVAATAGAPRRPADCTGGAAGWFALGKKKPAGIFPAPLRSGTRSIRAWQRRLRAPRHSVGRSEQRHGPGPRSGAGREEAGMPPESARLGARLSMEGAVRSDGSPRPSPDEDHEQFLRPVGAEDEDPLDVAGAARAGDEGEHAR